jgi:catechol 2,3-dioxygenase-like lactoylglutathione lyase family enzyme
MLHHAPAFASFSVNDLAETKAFYHNILGLEVTQEDFGVLHVQTQGNNPLMLYPKDDHEPATYTVLNFRVENIEETVDALIAKGVTFEQYEGEIQTDEKGISRNEWVTMAWFKDPSGNILSLLQEK